MSLANFDAKALEAKANWKYKEAEEAARETWEKLLQEAGAKTVAGDAEQAAGQASRNL